VNWIVQSLIADDLVNSYIVAPGILKHSSTCRDSYRDRRGNREWTVRPVALKV